MLARLLNRDIDLQMARQPRDGCRVGEGDGMKIEKEFRYITCWEGEDGN